MSADLSELYQQVILDHNRRPRNRGKLPTANRVAHGDNPTCGDQCSVYLRMDGARIAEISFDGSGCAISQATASMLTEYAKGKPAKTLLALEPKDVIELLAIELSPVRMKCALLSLETLKKALK